VPSAEQRRAAGRIAAIAGAIGLVVIVYPHVADALLERFGVRATCAALLALDAAWLVVSGRGRSGFAIPRWPNLAIAAVLGLGLISGHRAGLLLLPAIIYLAAADLFRLSLTTREDSILERGALWIVPEAPDFIRGYCRGLTWLWAGFFAAAAAVSAGLAVGGTPEAWRAFTGWGLYAVMTAVTVVEFLVRKTWFRHYYYGGPFDRFWSKLFPAENTERGRRSAEYIRRFRKPDAQNARVQG
jgi:uncharacterized membrane protein